jgi:lipopolysaccharide export LptBFGC system permease protein LptF
MPSLFRFLIVLVILGILGAAAMIYLAMFVGPHTREMTVRIPTEKLQVQQPPAPQAEVQPQAPPAQQ